MDSTDKSDSDAAEVVEVHSGYLRKSPPSSLAKNLKSWKRRFFVLAKISNSNYELRYYKNIERGTPVKSIKVSTITALYTRPDLHPTFQWILKNFNCSSSSVLFVTADDPADRGPREYFFIGDNNHEVDGWFYALMGALKRDRSMSQSELKNMTESESTNSNSCDTNQIQVNGDKRYSMGVTEDIDISSGDSLLDCVTKALNDLMREQTLTESKEETTHELSTTIKGQESSLSSQGLCTAENNKDSNQSTRAGPAPLLFLSSISECKQIQASCLSHKEDQNLAASDQLLDSVVEL